MSVDVKLVGGVGINFAVSEKIGINLMSKYTYIWNDKLDDRTSKAGNFHDQALMTNAMEGLFFESGSAKIQAKSYEVLDNMANVMNANKAYELYISGHTDNTGDKDMNLQLSKDRAASAKKYLVSKGIDASRITAAGFGDSQPRSSNDTQEGRTLNRRVEFNLKY